MLKRVGITMPIDEHLTGYEKYKIKLISMPDQALC